MELAKKKCVPCESGTPPLEEKKINEFLKEIPGWKLKDGHLYKKLKFADFSESIKFVNSIAGIAESEGHHPDFCVHYDKVEIEIWTHAINGLSENDFILAAKIDKASGK
ncbi:4a-hydroxytetrahydrobiopterin dehydratase [Candidatus Woesearchaeota archaeon]|nr:4a-hydroxytetrahydrobiopterin dehydratase [Candidatus Woesearchaeota archaeon]